MPAAQVRTVTAAPTQAGQRLDKFLAKTFPDLSRSLIQKLIENGAVTIDGRVAKAATRIEGGASIRLELPPPRAIEITPEALPLKVIYEDQDIVVLDKPAGLVVHPAPGHPTGTLVHGLLSRYPDLIVGMDIRPGIVHRLDKDTSGLLVIARNDSAMASLSRQMKEHRMLKEYLALVRGRLKTQRGVIEAPIGRHPKDRKKMAVVATGRAARTHFEVQEVLGNFTLVKARLETGRTHQIRVHFASIGHPVAGDVVYGPRDHDLPLQRQFLHAMKLGFESPTKGTWMEFISELPPDLASVLDWLRAQGRENKKP